MNTSKPIISVRAGSKCFQPGIYALNNVNLEIARGECVALLGASGSGKSTLLRTLCGLETFSNRESEVLIQSKILQRGGRLSRQVRELRHLTAIIFQQFNLVGRKSLLDNVLAGALPRMPLWRLVLGRFTHLERKQALQALETVGLIDYHAQRASTLSGGQQQRLCIARSVAVKPSVLLLDEPTSALDPISTGKVEELVHELKADYTIAIVTHNMQQAARCSDYTAYMYLGELVEFGETEQIFFKPNKTATEDYITGRFG